VTDAVDDLKQVDPASWDTSGASGTHSSPNKGPDWPCPWVPSHFFFVLPLTPLSCASALRWTVGIERQHRRAAVMCFCWLPVFYWIFIAQTLLHLAAKSTANSNQLHVMKH
jgi:hypothetical protein